MKTYHNAGGIGREYSRLEITSHGAGHGKTLLLMVLGQSDIVLNLEQAVDLRDELTKFIGKTAVKASEPMIEGERF